MIFLPNNKPDKSTPVSATTFTGKEKDAETGYSYFGARYYDSDLSGLFLSVDPMADKYPSISPYTYYAWNPVKLVDPDGEKITYSKLLLSKSIPQVNNNRIIENPPSSKTKTSDRIMSSIPHVLPIALLDGPTPSPADVVTGITITGIAIASEIAKTLETIEPWIRVGKEYLTQKMSQHGKKRISLSPEEVEKCNDILNNPKSTKKEKNEAKQKLKTHEKFQGERHSRQSNEKKELKNMGKFDFIFYNGESYILSSEELNTVLKTSYLSNRIINTILDDKTLDKLSIGDILDKYDYFTEKQVKKIEKYIYSHLKEKNSLFISDLIDCANRNNIESDIIFNFCINTIKKRRSSAIVLSSIVYLFEHMKIVQSVQLVPLFERVINNKTYYQDCQVVSAFCLFRITMNPKYLKYIKELTQIDETLRDVIRNKMLLMDYNKNKRLFYYTIEDFISGCR